jgi:hypothetical protein
LRGVAIKFAAATTFGRFAKLRQSDSPRQKVARGAGAGACGAGHGGLYPEPSTGAKLGPSSANISGLRGVFSLVVCAACTVYSSESDSPLSLTIIFLQLMELFRK